MQRNLFHLERVISFVNVLLYDFNYHVFNRGNIYLQHKLQIRSFSFAQST